MSWLADKRRKKKRTEGDGRKLRDGGTGSEVTVLRCRHPVSYGARGYQGIGCGLVGGGGSMRGDEAADGGSVALSFAGAEGSLRECLATLAGDRNGLSRRDANLKG